MTYQQDAQERAMAYGARMDEPLLPGDIDQMREEVDHGVSVDLDDPRLARITRLRLVGYCRDTPWWDVSYCYGQLKPGTDITLAEGKNCVRVIVPLRQIRRNVEAELIAWGRKNRVYVRGLGLLDGDVISKLYG